METPQTKNRLLLVDGDPKSLRVLDVSLKKAGFDVITATSGHDALASLAAELPDLIISDTDLTEMDGFELCNRIKAEPEWAKIPFLFVSGRKSIEDKIRGLELGVDDYLTKPIYIKEIGVRVRTALQRAERERMESRREGRTRFAGELSDVGVVDLVQTIELNRKSGIIHIVNRDDRRGSIFFRDGKVIDAEVGRLSGANALYRLFSWSEGQFAVEFKHIRRHDVIDLSMAALLMEGMRRLDESAHLLEHLPSLRHVLEVDCRVLAEELAELPDEMNSVLRLCDGARTLLEVIEDSDHPDLETLGIISKLYLGQIVFAREAPTRGTESQPGVRLANWLSEGGAEVRPIAAAPAREPEPVRPPEVLPTAAVFPPSAQAPANTVSAEQSLAEALPSSIDAAQEGGTDTDDRASDTLRGIRVDSLPDSAAPAEAAAAAAADAASELRNTAPLGLAERLLSGDSVVRASTLHEVLGDRDGDGQQSGADRHTHPYGNPVTTSAAALVQEVVTAARTTASQAPPPLEPERPSKEVDWGAWPTAGAPDPRATQIGRPASGAEESPGSKSTALPDATDLAVLDPSEGSSPGASANPTSPNDPEARAEPADLPTVAPEDIVPIAGEPVPLAWQPDVASSEPPDATPSSPRISLVPPAAAPSEPPANQSATSAEALQALRESSQSGRLWLLLIAAFGLGVGGGVFVLSRRPAQQEAAPTPPSMVAPSASEPAAPPSPPPVAAPAAAVAAPAAAVPAPAAAVAAPAAATAPAPAAASPIKAPAASPSALGDTATTDARQKCIETNADGKGRARAVVAACRPALETDPADAEIMVILARAEVDRGRFGEARSLARRALAADPQRVEAYVYLGTAEQAAGKVDEARAAYKKYLELAPDGSFARELRAILSNL